MKTKLLPILLTLLVVLNGVLIFMLIKKPHENRLGKRAQRNFLTEQLQFSESQKEQFRDLDLPHRDKMKEFDTKIREHKDFLFSSFSKENFSPDSIVSIIGDFEVKKEIEVFNFFKKVRNICKENQLNSFDEIIKQALNGKNRKPPVDGRMRPPMDGGHPPRDGRRPPR